LLLALAIWHDENIGAPILVTGGGKIIDGHTRYRISKALGYKKIKAVIIQQEITMVDIDAIQETY
jgi:ParB-like chromosome segregation protein Spo0J